MLVSTYRGSPSILVAASDALQATRDRADHLCNGTDDNVQINAAIDALPAGGGTIELSEGIFKLDIEVSNDCIDIAGRDNIHIKGQGMNITILQVDVINSRSVIKGDGSDRIALSDFTIDGNKATYSGNNGQGLRFLDQAADHLVIENIEIKNTDSHAMSISASHVWIRGCNVHNTDQGVQLNTQVVDAFLLHNIIEQVGVKWSVISDGIFFGGQHLTAIGNYIEEATDTGINIGGSTAPTGWAKCIGNTILLCGNSGINTGGGDHQIIQGNIIFACGRKDGVPRSNSGIRIRDSGSGTFTSNGVIVIGNRCYEDDVTYPLDAGALGMENGIEIVNALGGGDPDSLVITGNELTVVDAAPAGWTPILRTDMGAAVVITNNLGEVSKVVVRKSVDETVNNSEAFQNDDDLLFAIAANEIWRFEIWVFYNSATTPDIKFTITFPSGGTARFGNTNDATNRVETVSGTTLGQVSGDGEDEMLILAGVVVNGATAGNVQLQWAQNAATVSDTKVLTNSYLVAEKIEEAV